MTLSIQIESRSNYLQLFAFCLAFDLRANFSYFSLSTLSNCNMRGQTGLCISLRRAKRRRTVDPSGKISHFLKQKKGGQNPCPTLGENIATSSIRNIIHDFDFRSTSPLRLFTVDFSVFDHAAPKLTVCHFCLVLIDIFLMVFY